MKMECSISDSLILSKYNYILFNCFVKRKKTMISGTLNEIIQNPNAKYQVNYMQLIELLEKLINCSIYEIF
jgi:hypothetical protein